MKLDLNLNYSSTDYLTFQSGKIDDANMALLQYSNFCNRMNKSLFVDPPTVTESKAFANSHLIEMEHLTQHLKKKDVLVQQYMAIWAFNNYQDALSSLAMNHRRKDSSVKLPNDYYELSKSPKEVYNSDLTMIVPQSTRYVSQYLASLVPNDKKALDKLQASMLVLKENFSNQTLVQHIANNLLEEYISNYKLGQQSFDQDVRNFSEVASILSDEKRRNLMIQDFKNLEYSLAGTEMPDVEFKNVHGESVKLRSFRGKYVYIDLWASWCVPCIAEIPHLQKLEKAYADKGIVFISLSIDRSSEAWKRKVKELDLHGHQLEQGSSGYDKMMNIKGIPHFILYNPEGKLELYKAPRPSSPDSKALFNRLL